METLKAGCVLVNKENGCIGLIYREHLNDVTFPKGHLEKGEDLVTCAVRETAEETKRIASVVSSCEPYIEEYVTPKGEKCKCYYYLAIDGGKSDNDSWDTHDLLWVPFAEVEGKLSYSGLKTVWNYFKESVMGILNK